MSSAEHNVLIDDNGNAVGTIVSSSAGETNSSFLSSILKKMWPSRDVKLKYSASEFNTEDTSSEQSKSSSNGGYSSSGFWSRLSLLTSPTNEKAESSEESDSSESRGSNAGRADSLYSDNDTNAPQTKPNRKVYAESFFGIQGRVKTRRESILSNNRRHSRNYLNNNQNQNQYNYRMNYQNGCNIPAADRFRVENDNDNVGFRKSSSNSNSSSMDYETKRLSLRSFANENSQNYQSKIVARENFYNVNEMDMKSLYKTGKQSDLTIRCRGKEFRVHSFVLKAQSGQFRRILFMKSDSLPIVIDDMTPDDMEGLLKYMYTGEVDEKLCRINGEMSSRFEFLLQDYEVPLPEGCVPTQNAFI